MEEGEKDRKNWKCDRTEEQNAMTLSKASAAERAGDAEAERSIPAFATEREASFERG